MISLERNLFLNITESKNQKFLLKVHEATNRNFLNTMLHIEARLGISRDSVSSRDKQVHTAIRGAIFEHGKNLSTDILAEIQKLLD